METGVNNLKIEVKFKFLNNSGFAAAFGSNDSSSSTPARLQVVYVNKNDIQFGMGSNYASRNYDTDIIHTIIIDSSDASIIVDNGNKFYIGSPATYSQPTHQILFGTTLFSSQVIAYLSSERIYYAKYWKNNVLVRDFIPVLDANGTPCMFDKVEGKFYYNQGTGNFIAGPILDE